MIIVTGDIYLYKPTDIGQSYVRVEVFQADESRTTIRNSMFYAMPMMGSHIAFRDKTRAKMVYNIHRQFHKKNLTRLTVEGCDRFDLREEDHSYLIAYRKLQVV